MNDLTVSLIGAPMLPMMIIWVRISAFLAFVPFFNAARTSAVMTKMAFALILSFLLSGTLPVTTWEIPDQVLPFVLFMTGEVLVGLLIGLFIMILVMSLQVLGDIIGFQMAFSMARVIDATSGVPTNVISVFLVLICTVIFIALGGDHLLLWSLRQSFEVVPPGQVMPGREFIDLLFLWLSRMFELGVKVAFPSIVLLLSVDLTLGLIGRAASKMQIFFVGLPLKIAMGLYLVVVGLGFYITLWGNEVAVFPEWLGRLFAFMKS
jgi:flagellar biosynthetic protein FliR